LSVHAMRDTMVPDKSVHNYKVRIYSLFVLRLNFNIAVSLYIHNDGSGFLDDMGWEATKVFCESQGQRLCDISEVCEELGGASYHQDQICTGNG